MASTRPRTRGHRKRRIWRFLSLFGAGLVCLSSFVLTRYHFSHGSHPTLASLQNLLGIDQPHKTVPTNPLIIGHRGSGLPSVSGHITIGNTWRAIERGIEAEVDWLEIDIRRSQDNVLIVFHDDRLDHKTSGVGRLEDLTLAQIRTVTVLVSPPEQILTLEDVLTSAQTQSTRFVLDIKAAGIRDQLSQLISQHLAKRPPILVGTSAILREYQGIGYPLGYTALWSEDWNCLIGLQPSNTLSGRCQDLGAQYLILPQWFLTDSIIRQTKAVGLEIWTYGSEDPRDWHNSLVRGVDGIIVDDVSRARSIFVKP